METEKAHGLCVAQGNFDATMTFTEWALKDLHWWEQNIMSLWAPIRHSNPDKVIYTDGSKSGWGWARRDKNEQGGGRWSQEEAELHINVLELRQFICHSALCAKRTQTFTYESCLITRPQWPILTNKALCGRPHVTEWPDIFGSSHWYVIYGCPLLIAQGPQM